MKTTLLTLAAAFALLHSVEAQNLIVNGDFETGQLSPWTGGSIAADPQGGFQANTAFNLAQTVATTIGKKYYVAGEVLQALPVSGASITATPAGGGAADGARSVPFSSGAQRVGLLFTATTASTVIRFNAAPLPGSTLTVDDVAMLEVSATKLDGKYAGTIVTTVTLTAQNISNKASRKVTARIDENGGITILDGAQAIYSGTILNNGAFDITLGPGGAAGGTAKIRNGRIQLDFTSGSIPALGIDNIPVPNTVTNRIILNRR